MRLVRYGYKNPMEELLNNYFNNEEISNTSDCNVPKSNVIENNEAYEIQVATPGWKKKDININIDKDVLTISSAKKDEGDVAYTMREFGYDNFERSFHLPEDVDQNEISASYEDGVLTLSLPRKAEMKKVSKEIAIA